MFEHIDYPHQPGFLSSCYACTSGECQCDESSSGCESDNCINSSYWDMYAATLENDE